MESANKPKLVIATDNFLPRWDGIARFLSELIPRLLPHYEITVVSPDYGPSALDAAITRVLIPLRSGMVGDYRPAKLCPRTVGRAIRGADVVFTQTIGPVGFFAQRAARRQGKPLVAFIHSIEWELVPRALSFPLLKRIAYPIMKRVASALYNSCDLLIVPSENIGDMLVWQGIATRQRVAHLGVDMQRFAKGDRRAARAALRIPEGEIVIGFHGRLGREKNLLTLARAYVRLRGKRRLLVVGDGLVELKKKLGGLSGAMLVGAKDDPVPALQAMDIYVMPSFTETTCLAVLEAMSCELPVVCSPVGFLQQYVKDGENGFFFETRNAFDLSKKLQRLMDNAALRAEVGANARASVRKDFRWDLTAERIRGALDELLAQRRH